MLTIELGGKERNIRYGNNAICELEMKAGMGTPAILSETQMGFNTLRLLVWAGCRHENHGLTLDMVGLWLDEYFEQEGEEFNFVTLMEKVSEEFQKCSAVKKLLGKGN